MKEFLEANKLPDRPGINAEDRAAQKREDLWTTLAQIGFGTAAGTSQFGLENLGKGAAGAMPGMQEATKNRRADDKEERKDKFAYEVLQSGTKGKALEFETAARQRALENARAVDEAGAKVEAARLEAEAKAEQNRATNALQAQQNAALTNYYGKEETAVKNLADALVRGGEFPNTPQGRAQAMVRAIQELQGRGLGLNRTAMTWEQANKLAAEADMMGKLPKGMTVAQYARQLMAESGASGGGGGGGGATFLGFEG